MKKTTEHQNKIINFSFYQKKKIYNDFHAIIYKEFNKSISDINYFLNTITTIFLKFLKKHTMMVVQ